MLPAIDRITYPWAYGRRNSTLPRPTSAGYLPLRKNATMYYAYYEATQPASEHVERNTVPLILWLQGGPGCASLFGNFYELGPYILKDGRLQPNKWSWNSKHGLLFIDQPLGTGFSKAGCRGIPTNEMEIAADGYYALQQFFSKHSRLRRRPLFITGESYAGKYVPSIGASCIHVIHLPRTISGHYILQMESESRQSDPLQGGRSRTPRLNHIRQLQDDGLNHEEPKFHLAGIAIGDGLTDPLLQVQTHGDTAYYMGAISGRQRQVAKEMERQAAALIRRAKWHEAVRVREELLAFIQTSSGVATLYDIRRSKKYDAGNDVEAFINDPLVKDALRADRNTTFVGCDPEVARALAPDVMKSVKHLIPDLLAHLPVLLYQGQFDLQDGVATSQEWLDTLEWSGRDAFWNAPSHVWRLREQAVKGEKKAAATTYLAGRRKVAGSLTQVVIAHAGHMLPRDQGQSAHAMIVDWVTSALEYNVSDTGQTFVC